LTQKKWLSLLLCLALLLPSDTGWAVATYQVTEQELAQLEQALTAQETALQTALALLDGQNKDLITLQAQLQTVLDELATSRQEIMTLRSNLSTALTSIDDANQHFKEYAKEMKRKNQIVRMQRNIWAVLAFGVPSAAIMRKIKQNRAS